MKKILWTFVLGSVAASALLLTWPGIYFNKSVEYRNFTLLARGELPSGPEAVLDSALERIAGSELYNEEMKFQIILPATHGEFRFFTPFVTGEYFRLNPFKGFIFLAYADFEKGEARTEPLGRSRRALSSVITAAAAMEMTRLKLKPLTYISMNEWKARGYAERLSGGTGEFNPGDACAGGDRTGLRDYTYGLMLDTVLREENTFYNDLLDRNFSRHNAELRFRKAHCGGQE